MELVFKHLLYKFSSSIVAYSFKLWCVNNILLLNLRMDANSVWSVQLQFESIFFLLQLCFILLHSLTCASQMIWQNFLIKYLESLIIAKFKTRYYTMNVKLSCIVHIPCSSPIISPIIILSSGVFKIFMTGIYQQLSSRNHLRIDYQSNLSITRGRNFKVSWGAKVFKWSVEKVIHVWR